MESAMKRTQDWPERLTQFIEANAKRSFAYGTWDCALFAASACDVMTGDDPAREVRGAYTTADGALRTLLRHFGAWSVGGLADRLLGGRIPVALAQRGDIVLLNTERGDALGVCIGAKSAHPGPDGLMFKPIEESSMAWRLG